MIIVSPDPDLRRVPRRLRRHWPRIFRGLLFVAYTLLIFTIGAAAHRTHFFSRIVKPFVAGTLKTPVNYIKGLSTRPHRLTIDMNFEAYTKLAATRDRALDSGFLFASSEDYVPAVVRVGDRRVRVRTRLKGDSITHLIGKKWSFRVDVRGDDTIFGMKRFSLHHPQARNYLHEWVYHRALRREGLIALRYEFVEVTLNGEDLGVYALEEHFEKRLLENNERREGPIVRFSEDLMWRKIRQGRLHPGSLPSGTGAYKVAEIDGFQTQKMLEDPVLSKQYRHAVHLLEAFRRAELSCREVFAVEKLATFFALADLLGAAHGTTWHNFRFYYNPLLSKLEPIGFDGNTGQPIVHLSSVAPWTTDELGRVTVHTREFVDDLFKDPIFYSCYIEELERISDASYLDDLVAEIGEEMDHSLAILYREEPHVEFSMDTIYSNQEYIRGLLQPKKALRAHVREVSGKKLSVEIGNIHCLPIEVLALEFGRDPASGEYRMRLPLPRPRTLKPREPEALTQFEDLSLELPANPPWSDEAARSGRIRYRILGSKRILFTNVAPYPHRSRDDLALNLVRREPNAGDFPFVETDEKGKTIRLKEGTWTIDRDLVLPAGYTVVADGGVTLDLVSTAMVLSRSPLTLNGTAERPVVVRSSDETGEGLIVLGAGGESRLTHVEFPARGSMGADGRRDLLRVAGNA
jgi:hypothetical protein